MGLAILFALLWTMPLLWSVIAGFRPAGEPFTRGQVWFGSGLSIANYIKAFSLAPFALYFRNTVILVLMILAVQLVTSSMADLPLLFTGSKDRRSFLP